MSSKDTSSGRNFGKNARQQRAQTSQHKSSVLFKTKTNKIRDSAQKETNEVPDCTLKEICEVRDSAQKEKSEVGDSAQKRTFAELPGRLVFGSVADDNKQPRQSRKKDGYVDNALNDSGTHQEDDDISSNLPPQKKDDISVYDTSTTTEPQDIRSERQQQEEVGSEWLARSGHRRQRKRTTSNIPTLRGVSRKGPRSKSRSPETTSTATLSKKAPLYRSAVPSHHTESEAIRRGCIKTQHKQGQLSRSGVDDISSSSPLKPTVRDFTTGEIRQGSALPRLQHFTSDHSSGDARYRPDNLSAKDTIRQKRVTPILKKTYNSGSNTDDRSSHVLEGNGTVTTADQRTPPASITSQAIQTSTNGRQGLISQTRRQGLVVNKTSSVVLGSVPDRLSVALDKHSHTNIDILHPSPECRSLAEDSRDKRAPIVDESSKHDPELSTTTTITSAVVGVSSVPLITTVTNHSHASVKAASGPDGRGGDKPFTYKGDTPGEAVRVPSLRFQQTDCAGLEEYPSECEPRCVHSTACIVSPLETGPVSPVQRSSTRTGLESTFGESCGFSVLANTTTKTAASVSLDVSAHDCDVSDSPPLGQAALWGHDIAARQPYALSTCSTAVSPRNTPDHNIVSDPSPTSAGVVTTPDGRSALGAAFSSTPVQQPKQNLSDSPRFGFKKGDGESLRKRVRGQEISEGSNPCLSRPEESCIDSATERSHTNCGFVQDRETEFIPEQESCRVKQAVDCRQESPDKQSCRVKQTEDCNQPTIQSAVKGNPIINVSSALENSTEKEKEEDTEAGETRTTSDPSRYGVRECDKPDVSVHADEAGCVSVQGYDTCGDTALTIARAVDTTNRWCTPPTPTTARHRIGHLPHSRETDTKTPSVVRLPHLHSDSITAVSPSPERQTNDTGSKFSPTQSGQSNTIRHSEYSQTVISDAAVSCRNVPRKSAYNNSPKSFIPKRKHLTQTRVETDREDVCHADVSVTTRIDLASDDSLPENGGKCMERDEVYDQALYDKELLLSGKTLERFSVDHPASSGIVEGDKTARENDTAIYLTRIEDTAVLGDAKRCVDDAMECRKGAVSLCDEVTNVDNKLQAVPRDSNREPQGTWTSGLKDDYVQGLETVSSSVVIKGHTIEDAADPGASVKAATLTLTSDDNGGPSTSSRKSQLMSPPSRKKGSSASKENVCGKSRDSSHVDKHGGSKTSEAVSGEKAASAGTTESGNLKPGSKSGRESGASFSSSSSSSSRKRQGVTKCGENDITGLKTSASRSKPDNESTMSRRSHAAQVSSRTGPKATKTAIGSKTDSDATKSDISTRAARTTITVREAARQDRRSASPKLKQSKENENRKQKSASPQCTARSPTPIDALPAGTMKSTKSLTPSPESCELKQVNATPEGKSKAELLSEDRQDLSSPEKEKTDSPTKEKADSSLVQKKSKNSVEKDPKKDVKATATERTRSGLRSGSALKQQSSIRSTEALTESKGQTRTTSASTLRSVSSRTSSTKNSSSGTTTTTSVRPTLSSSRLGIKKTSSPESDASSTSDVSRTSRSSLISSTGSARLKTKESQTTGIHKPAKEDSKSRGRPSGTMMKTRSSISSSKIMSIKQEGRLTLKKTLSPSSHSVCSVSTRDSSVDSHLDDDAQSVVSSVSVRSARSSASSVARSNKRDVAREKQTKTGSVRDVQNTRHPKPSVKSTVDKNKVPTNTKLGDKHRYSTRSSSRIVPSATLETTPVSVLQVKSLSSNDSPNATQEGEELLTEKAEEPTRENPQSVDNRKEVAADVQEPASSSKGPSQNTKAAEKGKPASAKPKPITVAAAAAGAAAMKQKLDHSRREAKKDIAQTEESKQTRLTQQSSQHSLGKHSKTGNLPLSKPDKVKLGVKGLHSAQHSRQARETRRNSKQSAATPPTGATDPSQGKSDAKMLSASLNSGPGQHHIPPTLASTHRLTQHERNTSHDEVASPTELHPDVTTTEPQEKFTLEYSSVERDLINKSELESKHTLQRAEEGSEKGGGVDGRNDGLSGVKTSTHLTYFADVITMENSLDGQSSGYLQSVDKEFVSSDSFQTSRRQASSAPNSDSFSAMSRETVRGVHSLAADNNTSLTDSLSLSNSNSVEFNSSTPSVGNVSDSGAAQLESGSGRHITQESVKQFTPFSQLQLSPVMDSAVSPSSGSRIIRESTSRATHQQRREGISHDDEAVRGRQSKTGTKTQTGRGRGDKIEETHSDRLVSPEDEARMKLPSPALEEEGSDSPLPPVSSERGDKTLLYGAEGEQSGSDKLPSSQHLTSQRGVSPGRGVSPSSLGLMQNASPLVHHTAVTAPDSFYTNDESNGVPSARQQMEQQTMSRNEKRVENISLTDEERRHREERSPADVTQEAFTGERELEATETTVLRAGNTLVQEGTDRGALYLNIDVEKRSRERQTCADNEELLKLPTGTPAGTLTSPAQISTDSLPQLTRVSPSSVSHQHLPASSARKRHSVPTSVSSSSSSSSGSVPKAARRPSAGRAPISVRQRMTSSQPTLRTTSRPAGHPSTKLRPKPSPSSTSVSEASVSNVSPRFKSSLPTSSQCTTLPVSSRPFVTQQPSRRVQGSASHTCPGAKRGEGGAGANVLAADRTQLLLLPEQDRTHFPAGTAAATGPAPLTEQQDASEEGAEDRDVSPAHIAALTESQPAALLLTSPRVNDSLTDTRSCVTTPKPSLNDTLDSFSTPMGFHSPDVFSTPVGVCIEQNKQLRSGLTQTDSSVTSASSVNGHSLESEAVPEVFRAPPLGGISLSEMSQGVGKTCRTETTGVGCQRDGVRSPHPSHSPTLPAPSAKNSPCTPPLPVSSAHPACLSCATHGSHVSHSVSADGSASAPLSPHHQHHQQPQSSPPHRLNIQGRRTGIEQQQTQRLVSPSHSHSADVTASSSTHRYDVSVGQPVLSPDSVLSPTDSCSVSSMSARFLMDVCDTQAELLPCRYHSLDTMSSSASSGEMIFSSASSHNIPVEAAHRRASDTSHYVSPQLLANADLLQSAMSLESVALPSSNRTHRTEHVQFVSSGDVSSVTRGKNVPATLSSVTASSVSTVETYTSVFQMSISGSSHHRPLDNTATVTDGIYSSSNCRVNHICESDTGSAIVIGDGSSSDGLPLTSVLSAVDSALPAYATDTSDHTPSSNTLSADTEPSNTNSHETNTVVHATKECGVTSSEGSASRYSRTEEKRTRTKVVTKKACTVTVKPISTCVQDLQKITQEDHQTKPAKKVPHPVTLTSVKDSVMKFETSNRSRVVVNARTTKTMSSVKRSSSISSSGRSAGTDNQLKTAGTNLTRSVSTSRKESSSTSKQDSACRKTSQHLTNTTMPSHVSATTNVSMTTHSSTNATTVPQPTSSAPEIGTSVPEPGWVDSGDGESKAETADSGIEKKGGEEELPSVPHQEERISDTPNDEGRDAIALSASGKDDKQSALSAKESPAHTGLCKGMIMKKTSPETAVETRGVSPSRDVCMLSVQSDVHSCSVEEGQNGRSAHNQNHVSSSQRRGEEEGQCGGVPGMLRADNEHIHWHAEGVDAVDTQPATVPAHRSTVLDCARETRGDLSEECNRDCKHLEQDAKLAEDEAGIDISVPPLTSSGTAASGTETHNSQPTSSAREVVGRRSTEPRTGNGAMTEQHALSAAEDCVTLSQKVEQADKGDATSLSQALRESRSQTVSGRENCTVAAGEGLGRKPDTHTDRGNSSLEAVANQEQTLGDGALYESSTAQGELKNPSPVTQPHSQLPDKTRPASPVEVADSGCTAKAGQVSSQARKTDSDTSVLSQTKARKISNGASPVHTGSKKPGGRVSQVGQKKTKTPSPPRPRPATSGIVKREGSLKSKSTKENSASSLKTTSSVSTNSSTSHRSGSARKTSIDKTPSTVKDRSSSEALPGKAENAEDARSVAEREERKQETSEAVFRQEKDTSQINRTSAPSEPSETDVHHKINTDDTMQRTTRQEMDDGKGQRTTLTTSTDMSVSLSAPGDDKHSDRLTAEIPQQSLHRLTASCPEQVETSETLTTRSDAHGTDPLHADSSLKVTSHNSKVSTAGQHRPRLSAAENSKTARQDLNSTPSSSPDRQQIQQGPPRQQNTKQCSGPRVGVGVVSVSGDKRTVLEEDGSTVEQKQTGQSPSFGSEKTSEMAPTSSAEEKAETGRAMHGQNAVSHDIETVKTQVTELETTSSSDSVVTAQRMQNDNGQKAVAKWKRLVKTSRTTNLKETLTNKLVTPATRSDSVSPPPAPLSPTPPRRYKWAREGGIWKKIYLPDSLLDSAMGESVEDDSAPPSATADSGNQEDPDKTAKDKEDTGDDDRDAPIDFPSVLAMSKKFEQESEKQTQELKPRVTCRKMTDSAAKRSDSSSSKVEAKCQDHSGVPKVSAASLVPKTAPPSSTGRLVTGDSVHVQVRPRKASMLAGRDLTLDSDRNELDDHHPQPPSKLANPSIQTHQDTRISGQATAFPATEGASMKPDPSYCPDQNDEKLSTEPTRNPALYTQAGGDRLANMQRDRPSAPNDRVADRQQKAMSIIPGLHGRKTENPTVGMEDISAGPANTSGPRQIAARVISSENQNSEDQNRKANDRLQTTLAEKMAVCSETDAKVPHLLAVTDSLGPTPTFTSFSRVSNFAPGAQTVVGKGEETVGTDGNRNGRPETMQAEETLDRKTAGPQPSSRISATLDADVTGRNPAEKFRLTQQQQHQETTTTNNTSVNAGNQINICSSSSTSTTKPQTDNTLPTAFTQTGIQCQPQQLHNSAARISHTDNHNDGRTSVNNSDTVVQSFLLRGTDLTSADDPHNGGQGTRVSRAGEVVDTEVSQPTLVCHQPARASDNAQGRGEAARMRQGRGGSPRAFNEQSKEGEGIASQQRVPTSRMTATSSPSPSRAITSKRNDPTVRDSADSGIKTNEAVGSRSPVPTRLSEGLKRFQKSRGAPWGQQYVQRGDRVTSPQASMAASNWRLLVSKMAATAGQAEVSGGRGQCTADENVKETKQPLSVPAVKEAVVPIKEMSPSGLAVQAQPVSDGTAENNTLVSSDTAPNSVCDTNNARPGSLSSHHTRLTQSGSTVKHTAAEVTGDVQESPWADSGMETDGLLVASAQDISDTRIETTFSDTVFESRVPAKTPPSISPRRDTPRQRRRGTPERGTPDHSTKTDTEPTSPAVKDCDSSNRFSEGSADSMNTSSASSTSSKLRRQFGRSKINHVDECEASDDMRSPSVLGEETEKDIGVQSSPDPQPSSFLSSPPPRSSRGGTCAKLISMTVWDTHDGDKALRSGTRRVFWDLDSKELLAGISEQEEQGCTQDDVHAPKTVSTTSSTPHVSRSLQATPEKHRDTSRDRDVTTSHSRRRRNTRRSLSLPTGSLSYGDIKISYRDGHFVTEPVEEGGSSAQRTSRRDRGHYDRSRSDSSAAVLCGSLMNISSQEEMREEILSLLERGFSTDDITLLFSRYLDQNSNHLAESAPSQSTQSLNAPSLYQTQSLPRSRRHREALNRPASDVNLCQQFSQSEQNLVREERIEDMNRRESFYRAMTTSVVPGRGLEEGEVSPNRLQRHNSDETRTSRSQRPGFIQRMLQKRKSFHDKPSANGRTPREEAASSSRKEAKDSVARKVSIKGIFKRKNSTSSVESKKDPEEPSSPPIATFMYDDDIGAVSSVPGSPTSFGFGGRTQSSSQLGQIGECSSDVCSDQDEADSSVFRRRRQFLPGDGAGKRVSERYSGEYSNSELDTASESRSSQDTLTPRSTSPSNASTLTLEGDSSRISEDEEAEALDRTLGKGVDALNTSLDVDSTLLASPGSLDRTRVSVDRTPVNSVGHAPRPGGKHSVPKQDLDKLAAIVQGEITSSNSNDSGIQHDVTIGSSESLKLSADLASQLTSAVKLRNSPSPKQERPKSDFTVRWADLLEQVKETDGIYRRDGARLRKRPRPKSDLAEDSGDDEGLDYDSTSSEEGGSSILADPSWRPLGGALGALGLGSLGAGGSGLPLPGGQQYDSILDLVELRRPANRGRLDTAALQAAKLAKSRRMSTPHPIKTRAEKVVPKSPKRVCLVRSHSMPDNLDRLHRKKNYFSLIGCDMQNDYNHTSGGEDSSDESELSMDYQQEKSLSTRASRVTLATLDQMIEEENLTYAEALWDHVTMDPDELGFRAGDLIRVTDTADKHWWYGATEHRDGWFPAAFVRLRVNQDDLEAEMTRRVLEEEEEEAQRQTALQTTSAPGTSSNKTQLRANVVNEIITAEAEYVKHLRDVIEGYLKQAKKRPEMFPPEKVIVIFSNIEVIYDFATRLLGDLQSAVNKEQPHLTEFGHCFLDKTQQFEIYSEYCNNHPAACEELREMFRVKRYRHFFEACRLLQEMTEIPLEGFLLTPVQKICKYHLQLAELLKYTPEDHPDYSHVQSAVKAMKHIAKLVNERKRKMEFIETLAEWQMTVDDWEGPDILDDSSELIHSGELNKINANGWSQERFLFLFDHQLVYCKKDLLKKNSFVYKGRISMDNTEVNSVTDGRDTQYNVTVRNAIKLHDKERNKWYLLVAKTAEQKQRWLRAFSTERRRVQEDTENNFNIPQHLKQTIVSNLKQKSGNKSKGKRKVSRSSSLRNTKNDAWASATATLPRIPRKSAQGSTSQQSNKIMNFLLGGKKK